MTTMQAAVIYGPGDVRMERVDIPEPGPDEVLVRIKACGVCGTDQALNVGEFPANFPVIIGHEFSGEVTAVGKAVNNFVVGDRVTADPNRVCHRCEYCRMGLEHLCENRQSMGVDSHGADAEFAIVPETNLYQIPDHLSYEEAAFTEPLACAVNGTNLAQIKLGDTVLILGAGGMGNLITQCAAHAGAANIIVSEPIEYRRKIAKANGATHVIDPFNEDVDGALRDIRKIGADVVFEAAGNNKLQETALQYVRKGGTVVWFGCSPVGKTIPIDSFDVNDREVRIQGSFNNPYSTGRAIKLLGSGAVRVDNLISHHIPLKDYLSVFDIFGSSDSLKLMVEMD